MFYKWWKFHALIIKCTIGYLIYYTIGQIVWKIQCRLPCVIRLEGFFLHISASMENALPTQKCSMASNYLISGEFRRGHKSAHKNFFFFGNFLATGL